MPSKKNKATITRQRRPNLRESTQRKWDLIQKKSGWKSDTETADRLADFYIEQRGIS